MRTSVKNVKTLRAAHESWNKRDFAGVTRDAAENLTYTDNALNARALMLNGRDKFREWTEAWAKVFSKGRITDPEGQDLKRYSPLRDTHSRYTARRQGQGRPRHTRIVYIA